jgi:hypothetical protein
MSAHAEGPIFWIMNELTKKPVCRDESEEQPKKVLKLSGKSVVIPIEQGEALSPDSDQLVNGATRIRAIAEAQGPKCNRRACKNPHDGWFNSSTLAFYCEACKKRIQHGEDENLFTKYVFRSDSKELALKKAAFTALADADIFDSLATEFPAAMLRELRESLEEELGM